MASFFWFAFGPPTPLRRAAHPETRVYESCLNVGSVLKVDDGKINIGFEEDTSWCEEDNFRCFGRGVAVVKLGLQVQSPSKMLMSRVECSMAFSQSGENHFRGVHDCWPALSKAQPHASQKGHETATHLSTSTEGSNLPAQKFVSQRGMSSGEAVGLFDMVEYTLEPPDRSRFVRSTHKKLCGAVVLQCAEGDLIVETRLKATEQRSWLDLRVDRTIIHEVVTSVRFKMTDAKCRTPLRTICEEVENWLHRENHHVSQPGTIGPNTIRTLQLIPVQRYPEGRRSKFLTVRTK
jgi:hypothetical protein